MCGISGFVGAPDTLTLRAMTDALTHRGPDEAGYFENEHVSLGMRRLSIVDVETGQQPVFNEDRTIAVVFNGEIFNFVELREQLIKQGHLFRTHHSDTEVLVHLYEEYGVKMLDHLNGMFAFAIWDNNKERLFFARDHAGIKPLFFTKVDGKLLFSSEIKSFFRYPKFKKIPNFEALYHYFTFKNVPAPHSAFEGVNQLRAGEYGLYEKGNLSIRRWWSLQFAESASETVSDYTGPLLDLLDDSVKLRMRSDVPVGAYLSGGLDSSAAVALMTRYTNRPVKTFSLVYEDKHSYKHLDREFASLISTMYKTEHYEYVLRPKEVFDDVEDVLVCFDEPFSGVTSTYFLSKLIAKHVKVAMSGDGADELFASYLPHRLASALHNFGRLRGRLSDLSPADLSTLEPFSEKLSYLSEIHSLGDESRRRMGQYLLTDEYKRESLLTRRFFDNSETSIPDSISLIANIYDHNPSSDPVNRALKVDIETLLPDQVLAFVDRLSMAHSLEVRPPFLDKRIMEFSATIPGSLKMYRGQFKYVLKRALAGLLPDELLNRPKEGFVLPINDWLLGENSVFVNEILAIENLKKHGFINPAAVAQLVTEYKSGRKELGARIWNLITFQMWWDKHF